MTTRLRSRGLASGALLATLTISVVSTAKLSTAKQSGDTFDIKGSASVNINDFGVKAPSYLGVRVKPDVSINIQRQTKDRCSHDET